MVGYRFAGEGHYPVMYLVKETVHSYLPPFRIYSGYIPEI